MPKAPTTAVEMVEYLDLELLERPQVRMIDFDLVTGAVCVLMENGQRFELIVSVSPAVE